MTWQLGDCEVACAMVRAICGHVPPIINHSRISKHNAVYRADLLLKAAKWADWLDDRFVTRDVTKAGVVALTPIEQPAGGPA